MRKYRLHGLIFSLLLLAALFIWKNSLSLVPPLEDASMDQGTPVVTGKDSIAGFVNLLRRGIPRSGILSVCFEEWQKTFSRRAFISAAQRQEIERLARPEDSDRNSVETYAPSMRCCTAVNDYFP